MSQVVDTPSSMPPAYKVLSASYIEKHKDRKDLVRRLRNAAHLLKPIAEVDSQEYPGMQAMCMSLVKVGLDHKDKDVRLYTVLCCMELFEVFAPEAPWDEGQVCHIFQQTIQQLSNLSHTTQPTQPHYAMYLRILELLAEVNVGAILVNLAQNDLEEEEEPFEHEKPLELLSDLFHRALHSLRLQHTAIVTEYIEKMINGCLGEFQGIIPVQVVDQLLLCVGQGPTTMVTNPALAQQPKGRQRNNLPPKISEANPSHMLACSIIRKNTLALSNPISNLLNGLLNGDAHVLEQSVIAAHTEEEDGDDSSIDVWTILYRLGMAAPGMLTSVMGAVSECLESQSLERRTKAVNLMGQLFSAEGSKLPAKFSHCFQTWVQRYKDVDKDIRLTMVKCLVLLVTNNSDTSTVQLCERVLIWMMMNEKELEMRLFALRAVCDFAFGNSKSKNACSAELLEAVGNRVESKDEEERLQAVTALSQIYLKFYTRPIIQGIHEAGEHCSVELIAQVLKENCNLLAGAGLEDDDEVDGDLGEDSNARAERNKKYRWIPSRILLGFIWTTDHRFQNRLTQCVDDLLLGSDISKTANKNFSPSAGAVGLTILLSSLRAPDDDANLLVKHPTSNAFHFLHNFFNVRTKIQDAVGDYLQARTKVRSFEKGSEEYFAADSAAIQKLEEVAALLPPPDSSSSSLDDILSALHGARDKHIFRILATLTTPLQGKSTRIRALDELPKRVKSLGDEVSTWVRTLTRRAVMGSLINVDIVHHCLCWAAECLKGGEIECCVALMSSVSVALASSSTICDDQRNFKIVKDMFASCRGAPSFDQDEREFKRQVEESGLVSFLISLLATTARARQKSTPRGLLSFEQLDERLRKQLLQCCTKNGTPQQARSAVSVLATTFGKQESSDGQDDSDGGESDDEAAEQSFSWLFKALTAASNLSIDSKQVIGILAALAELSRRAPRSFSQGAEAVTRFALEGILLGRLAGGKGDSESEEEDVDGAAAKKRSKPAKRRKRALTPTKASCLLENEELSFACRRSCAAIEFLSRYVISIVQRSQLGEDVVVPSDETIRVLFSTLTDIIRDHGVPPSNRDKDLCSNRGDLAALRQCAAQHLLRLCSNRRLEGKFLTCRMWHTLGEIFVDEETAVRCSLIEELNQMMKGVGFFKGHEPPSLRFMAFIIYCADGGNAAHVGKLSQIAKSAAQQGISRIRQRYNHAAATVDDDEDPHREFMSTFKYTPEYITFYTIHLLTFRRDTPTTDKTTESKMSKTDVGLHRLLKKRLKWLFDPLVLSLGDVADNVSFLLGILGRLAEAVPVGFTESSSTLPTKGKKKGPLKKASIEETKLRIICETARDVLLSFVKKDNDLDQHPNLPPMPQSLFRHKDDVPPMVASPARPNFSDISDSEGEAEKKQKKKTPAKRSKRGEKHDSDDEGEEKPTKKTPAKRREKDDSSRDSEDEDNAAKTTPAKCNRTKRREEETSSRDSEDEDKLETQPPRHSHRRRTKDVAKEEKKAPEKEHVADGKETKAAKRSTKRGAPPIPSQVSVDPSNDEASVLSSPTKRTRMDPAQSSDEDEKQTPKAKPLRDSNRSTRGAKRNQKSMVSPTPNAGKTRPKRKCRTDG